MKSINIVKPIHPSISSFFSEFGQSLDSGLVTNNSQYVRMFEEKLQGFFGCPVKPSVNCNGEMGLFHLFQAWKHKLGFGPHDSFEVLVPSFTFSGTIHAIVTNNLKPVFCDVDPGLILDLEKLIVDSPDIKMIVPVAAYGNIVDLDRLRSIATSHNLTVILDNAPAFGTRLRGKLPWEFGFSEMISFHATKIFSTMEGGCNIVNDPEIDALLRRLRDFGQYEKTRGDVDIPGLNSKMTEVCALVGLKNLEKADWIISTRASVAKRYTDFFSHLEKKGLLQTMKVSTDVHCPYLYFPIILNNDATSFVAFMQKKNIAVRRYYTANHSLSYYRGRYRCQDLSFTETVKDRIVSLPLFTQMTEEEMGYLFDSVAEFFQI